MSRDIPFLCMWHETCSLDPKITQGERKAIIQTGLVHLKLCKVQSARVFFNDFRLLKWHTLLFALLIWVTVDDIRVSLILNLCLKSYWCFSCCSDCYHYFRVICLCKNELQTKRTMGGWKQQIERWMDGCTFGVFLVLIVIFGWFFLESLKKVFCRNIWLSIALLQNKN